MQKCFIVGKQMKEKSSIGHMGGDEERAATWLHNLIFIVCFRISTLLPGHCPTL